MKDFFVFILLCVALPVMAANEGVSDSVPTRERTLDQIEVVGEQMTMEGAQYRPVAVLTAEDIRLLPVQTVADLLQYLPGIDIRERGASGVQADLAMRGGTAKQVKVLLNGIDMTDPQTEHYTMDLPLDALLIERVEMLQGTNYAVDAFSGAVNIITKPSAISLQPSAPMPQESKNASNTLFLGSLTAGEYGLIHPALAVRTQRGDWYLNASASYNRSSGYAANTDYRITNAYFQTGYRGLDIQLGAQMKDAGANAFYSVKYPNQFDATRTAFLTAAYDHQWQNGWAVRTNAYYRAHYDRFELFRDSMDADGLPAPAWYTPNRHWTHTAGLHAEAGWSNTWSKTTAGVELRDEYIRSSNMGVHNRLQLRYFAEQRFYWRGLSASLGASGVWNSQFGHDWSAGLNLAYQPIRDLHLYLNVNRAIRVPTFTDLYYQSATQMADSTARPERALQVELSAQYTHDHWYASVAGYYRWGRDIIDWIKPADPTVIQWRSTNNTRVDAAGAEATIGVQGYYWLQRLELSYAFCDVRANAGGMMSMYALDYLRHKATLRLEHRIYRGFGASWSLSFRQRQGEYTALDGTIQNYRPVFLLDGSLYWKNDRMKVSIDAHNMADQLYYDFSGVIQPRHWVTAGISFGI